MNTIRFAAILVLTALYVSAQESPGSSQEPTADKSQSAPLASPSTLNEFLQAGTFNEGVEFFGQPKNNEERFSLAFLQVFGALQKFAVEINRISLNPELTELAGLNLPASGPPVLAEQLARTFYELKSSLKQANQTLSLVDDKPFSVPVDFSKVRFTIDGSGILTPVESLLAPIAEMSGEGGMWVHFDSADAAWLQGYTHLVPGLLEVFTSYDWMPVWNQCAHHLFLNPQPRPPIARHSSPEHFGDTGQIADLIAALHDMRLKVVDPEGLRRARDEFSGMARCSRICWKRIMAETDDDHEWLPSPDQTGPGGAKTTPEQIQAWHHVLDEIDAVLSGKKLLAHWRIKEGTGINVDRMVNDPPNLDLVLMAQGSAFIPYLEEGVTSDLDTWGTLIEPFGDSFALFAIWSN